MTALSTPSRAREKTVFGATQYQLPYPQGAERHFWNHARSRIVERHLRCSMSNPRALVLDVGCGVGLTVDHLRRAGIDCRGVELGRPQLRPGLDEFVKTGIDACDLPAAIRERTATILLLDVLEHIGDPVSFLKELRANFSVLERIVVTVPARMELWSNYDVFYGHFRRYNKPQLARLTEQAALDIITLKYFFVSLYPPTLAVARLMRQRSLAAKAPKGFLAKLHALIGMGFVMEERLPFVGLLPGTSLLAVLSVRRQPEVVVMNGVTK